jgi:hypothetical protein
MDDLERDARRVVRGVLMAWLVIWVPVFLALTVLTVASCVPRQIRREEHRCRESLKAIASTCALVDCETRLDAEEARCRANMEAMR